ncbi:hypothetical protein, conserved [Trypanosoma brucei gambiense DAL972]|uniref:Uncharacterized protein n=1 Tax=Trypanosoma brucei gambiense (strain MHOM/CI/86/DAL972) TaxID=679716 RepID=C9ZTI1_TRYB9|nr:hypothetical protein, conserved [Trypanosoma brucei gambiense DAL972]CBH12716.1 hypothetical protein, conserved [Trypanosoma brucei gambiense DAL972]|eukprot:XP_011774996.1 hypothetical protein, conserved [Trypanosoma brucei gambiense DAL972]
MPISPLALTWVTAHLKRRGLPCNIPGVTAAEVCSEEEPKPAAEPQHDAKPLSPDELLQALGHCFTSQPPKKEMTSNQNLVKNPNGLAEHETSLSPQHRSTPQRVASGIVKLVEQHEERSAATKGTTQSLLLLNTVLTACMRHALRYSRLDASKGEDVTASGGDGASTVSPSQQIAFPWSADRAANHLLHVFSDDAVQKQLRTRLWKIVSKEHKQIVGDATKLFRSLPIDGSGAINFGEGTSVAEEELKRMFYIPESTVVATYDAIRKLYNAEEPTLILSDAWSSGVNGGEVSLLSECHFVYEVSSQHLADLLMQEVRANAMKEEKTKAVNCEDLGAALQQPYSKFTSQFCTLLMEMSRVRMAAAVLMQFEILARRIALLAKGPAVNQQRGSCDTFVDLGVAVAAQELCTLAVTSSSRVLETALHKKRFTTLFRVTVGESPSLTSRGDQRKSSNDEQNGAVVTGPLPTLGSAFALLSLGSPIKKVAAVERAKARASSEVTLAANSTDVLGDSGSCEQNNSSVGPGDPSGVKSVDCAATYGAFMQTIMKAAGATNSRATLNGKRSKGKARHTTSTEGAPSGTSDGIQQHRNEQTEPSATWKFRCCRMQRDNVLDALEAIPCAEKDAKVQLLRSSTDIPWPFTLDAIPADGGRSNLDCGGGNCGSSNSSTLLQATGGFTSTVTDMTVRMKFNESWFPPTERMHTSACTAHDGGGTTTTHGTGFTPMDFQHASQLQRVLAFNDGRFLFMNGCPASKVKPLNRLARESLKLVVRFR